MAEAPRDQKIGDKIERLRRDLAELEWLADELRHAAAHIEPADLQMYLRRIERLKLRARDAMRMLLH